jgi:hypothetical protein
MTKTKSKTLTMPPGYPGTPLEERTAMRRGWTRFNGYWIPPSNLDQADVDRILHARQRRESSEVQELQGGNIGRKVKTPARPDSPH